MDDGAACGRIVQHCCQFLLDPLCCKITHFAIGVEICNILNGIGVGAQRLGTFVHFIPTGSVLSVCHVNFDKFLKFFSHLMKYFNGHVLKIFSGSFSEKCSIKTCRKISSSFIGILLAGFCRVLGFQQKSRSGQTKFQKSRNLILSLWETNIMYKMER